MRWLVLFALGGLVTLIAAAAMLTTWSILRWDRYTRSMQTGSAALQRGDLPAAETAFGAAASNALSRAQAAQSYAGRGEAEMRQLKLDEAIEDETLAIECGLRGSAVYAVRGLAYEGKHDVADALEDYDTALAQDPNNGVVHFHRYEIFNARHDWPHAVKDLTEVIRCRPDTAVAYCTRGVCLLQMQQEDRAVSDFETALRLDPLFIAAYQGRSLFYRQNAQLQRAEADRAAAEACYALLGTTDQISPASALASESAKTAYRFSKAADAANLVGDYKQAINLYNIALAAPYLDPRNRAAFH